MNKIKGKKLLLRIAAAVLALALAFTGGLLLAAHKKAARTAAPADLLAERITAIGELATVEYHYTNMAKFENSLELYGWTVPLTQSSFVLSYDGVIKAGVDLSSVRVTQSGTTFTITLTKPAILSHEIDEDSVTVFDELSNIFNPISVSDYAAFSAQQKKAVEAGAVGKGLITSAQQNAEDQLTRLLVAVTPEYAQYTFQYVWLDA